MQLIKRTLFSLFALLALGVTPAAAQFGACLPGFCSQQGYNPCDSRIKLLMPMEGTNGSTGSPGLDDFSSQHRGTATSGASSTIDTSQFKFGSSSYRMHSVVGNSLNYPPSADWVLSSANSDEFTVEAWVRWNTLATGQAVLSNSGFGASVGWLLWTDPVTSTELNFTFSPDGTVGAEVVTATSGAGLTTGTWIAVAADKDATGKIRVYVNGVMKGSSTPGASAFFNTVPSLTGLGILSVYPFGSRLDGWIDEVRITKGKAWYASDAGYTLASVAFATCP